MGSTETSLLDDLDAALQGGSSDKRVDMLKRVTNLFVSDAPRLRDRKSTRLNSSHITISYAVFCLKKKKPTKADNLLRSPPPVPQSYRGNLLRHAARPGPSPLTPNTPHVPSPRVPAATHSPASPPP